MAQTPEQITAGDLGDVTWDPARGQAFVDGGLDAGLEYTVRSRVVVPTAEQLDQVRNLDDPAVRAVDPTSPARTSSIHGSRRSRNDVDGTAPTRTTTRCSRSSSTSTATGSGTARTSTWPTTPDALLTFLTQTKAGFCQQYATAMAVLVRELGLPARVAVGYQAGTLQDDGRYLVQSEDAHAWVEVFFEGYGWLQFEPTPGHGTHPNAEPGTYLNPAKGATNPGGAGHRPLTTRATWAAGAEPNASRQPTSLPGSASSCARSRTGPSGDRATSSPCHRSGPPRPDGSGYSVPYRLIFLGLLIALGVLLIVVPIAKSAWRRRLLRRSREPREHVLAAYRVFDGEAADLGLGRRDGETLDEHRARLAAAIAFTDGHLGRLTTQATRAAYAAESPTPEEAKASVEDAHRAIRELRKDAGLIRRIVGRTGRASRRRRQRPVCARAAASRSARTKRSRSSRNWPTLLSTPVAISSIATKKASWPSRKASMISPLRRAILKMLTPSVMSLTSDRCLSSAARRFR